MAQLGFLTMEEEYSELFTKYCELCEKCGSFMMDCFYNRRSQPPTPKEIIKYHFLHIKENQRKELNDILIKLSNKEKKEYGDN